MMKPIKIKRILILILEMFMESIKRLFFKERKLSQHLEDDVSISTFSMNRPNYWTDTPQSEDVQELMMAKCLRRLEDGVSFYTNSRIMTIGYAQKLKKFKISLDFICLHELMKLEADVSFYTNSRFSKGFLWLPNSWTDRPQSGDVQETRASVWQRYALYMPNLDVQEMKKSEISVDFSRSTIILHPHLISSLMNANDIFIEYKRSLDRSLSPFRFTPISPLSPFRFTSTSLSSLLKSKEQYEKPNLIPPPSLSDFPVELIHHIQSLLPVKEAARTSIISKALLNAWQTIHKLRFHFNGMRQEMYYNLMLRALRRYRRNLLPIESFDLELVISNKETASLVQDWIRQVSNPKACLKELLLDISVSTDSSFTLPIEVLSSKTLNSIIVTTDTHTDVKLFFHSNPEMIQCVYLRVLNLEYVFISDDVLAKLLSVCSLLEKISLFCCEGLKTVKVKNLVFLCELKIHVLDIEPIVTIINVPQLLKVDYFPLFPPIEKPPPFNMDSFGSVKQLVIADVLMDYEFFDTIKSKLLLLESLTLRIGEWAQENFVISSVSLKKLDLQIWISKQFVIEVCASQLMSCVCECPEPGPSISFATGVPEQLKVTTHKRYSIT